MRLALAALSLIALAGCEPPLQSCLSAATQDLATVDALIARARLDLQRGFGTTERQEVRTIRRLCPDFNSDGSVGFEWCDEVFVRTVEEPVAINLRETQAILAQLEQKRVQLIPQSNAAVAQCQATFPA